MLREYEWSETSQVVVLLTRGHGKVRGLAKGSKRLSPSSVQRFSGGIELLTLGEVIATTKRTTELASVTEWDQQRTYPVLRQDLAAQWLAMYAAEVTAAMLADLDAHPAVFDALGRFLGELAGEDATPQTALLCYQWALLSDCGYRPELAADVQTGQPLDGAAAYTFDATHGGLTHHEGASDWRVRAQTVALLRSVAAERPLDGAADDALARANRLLCVYIRALLDRELNTMRVVLGDT